MPQIMPIKDLKDTSHISEMCHKAEEPIFITKNGYGDMVMMSMELFESMQKKWSMYSDIELSEQQLNPYYSLCARIRKPPYMQPSNMLIRPRRPAAKTGLPDRFAYMT